MPFNSDVLKTCTACGSMQMDLTLTAGNGYIIQHEHWTECYFYVFLLKLLRFIIYIEGTIF